MSYRKTSRIAQILLVFLCGVAGVADAADPVAGQRAMFTLGCTGCHQLRREGGNGVGPALFNVVGAAKASHVGFAYSPALRAKGGVWSAAELDVWLTNPAAFAPGTKMAFAGIADASTRADVIAYLGTLSDRAAAPVR
ncbi:MAG: c-type cytochrome [Acetobacteraceae bacterium]|nr:c-type cytochrome [Acetobacteraceae bacterium]